MGCFYDRFIRISMIKHIYTYIFRCVIFFVALVLLTHSRSLQGTNTFGLIWEVFSLSLYILGFICTFLWSNLLNAIVKWNWWMCESQKLLQPFHGLLCIFYNRFWYLKHCECVCVCFLTSGFILSNVRFYFTASHLFLKWCTKTEKQI